MNILIIGVLILCFTILLIALFMLRPANTRSPKELAEEIYRMNDMQRKTDIEAVINKLKDSFGQLSFEALSKSTDEFLKLAKSKLDTEREVSIKELESKKSLIDQQLKDINTTLENVTNVMKTLEKDRVEKFGSLENQLKNAGEQTASLIETTNKLREALASSKTRGQWGERMADDVLRLAGFAENVNYLKQKAIAGVGSRPDFTFLLPKDLKLNMDAKFPLDNYMKYLEASSDQDKSKCRNDFLKDVKAKVKEVTSRDYINPEQNTVDYVILFIPNEQIYTFIYQQDSSILDDAIRNKVIFCSPFTLFAVLAVIRQAIDNFALEKTSNEMLSLFGAFKKQWEEFIKKLELLGKRINDTHNEYDSLITTRKRQLEKPLNKIEDLRIEAGLPVAEEHGSPVLLEHHDNL